MERNITLGLNILLAVFVVSGIFWGFIRGLRKTTCRSIFLILITILLLFITPWITKLLLNIPLNLSLQINEISITGTHTLEEFLNKTFTALLGQDFVSSTPDLANFILSIPLLIINTVVYIILFWILKYLLLPLNRIFYNIAFAPRVKKETLGFSNFGEENPFSDIEFANDKIQPIPSDVTVTTEEQENQITQQPHTKAPNVEQPIPQQPSSQESQASEMGMFIVKDPEYNKHHNLSKKTQEITKTKTPKEEKKEKKRTKKQILKKYKKHRLWGALVGAVTGLIVMFNTLVPVYGLMDIFNSVNSVKIENITDEEMSVTTLTDGLNNEIINAYNNSILRQVSKYSGIEGLGVASFDFLTTTKQGDNKITLREDINTIVSTVEKVDKLFGKYKKFSNNGNLSDLNEEEIGELISDTKVLLNETKKIKLVNAISDYIIPVAGNYLIANNIEFTDNPIINQLIAEMIVEMLNASGIDLFKEMEGIIDIAEYLNDQKLLTKVLQNDFDNPIAIIQDLDDDFADQLTTRLYKLQLVDLSLPYIMNISFSFLDAVTEFGFSENEASVDQLKSSINTFLNKTIILAKTLDSESNIYITTNSLIPLGDLLETCKSSHLINTETYQNLLSYAEKKLRTIFNDIVPAGLQPSITNEVLGNIHNVDNWKVEMTIINQALTRLRHTENGFVGTVVDGSYLRQGFTIDLDISQNVLNNLGETLDILESTCLFGSINTRLLNLDGYGNSEYTLSTLSFVMCDALDYISTNMLAEKGYEQLNDFIVKVKTNILESNHKYVNDNKFWLNEFELTSPLIVELSQTISGESFNISKSLGEKLDIAKNSIMLGNNACLTLIDSALSIVKDGILDDNYTYNDGSDSTNPQVLNDKIYELFEDISTQLTTITSVKHDESTIEDFWTTEIDKYLSLINIANKASTLNDISDITANNLDKDLDNAFYGSYTIPKLTLSKTFAFVIRDINSSSTFITDEINSTISNIADKLENKDFINDLTENNFWQIELGHINKLINLDFETNLIDNLDTIGKSLDEVCNGYTKVICEDDPDTAENEYQSENIRPSKLISHNDLRRILGGAINQCKDDLLVSFSGNIQTALSTALNDIHANIIDTTNIPNISFEIELGHLKTLSQVELSSDIFQTSSDTIIQDKNKQSLINLGISLDSIAFNLLSNGNEYNEAVNSLIISRRTIHTLIYDIFDEGKMVTDDTSTIDDTYNKAITSIKSNIQTTRDNDAIISWQQEMAFVGTLTQVDIQNISFEKGSANSAVLLSLGQSLDSIAFNIGSYIDSNTNKIFYAYNDAINSQLITRPIINTLIYDIFDECKMPADDTTTTDDTYNKAITSIKANIQTIRDNDTIISWAKELEFVSTLTEIDFDGSYFQKADTPEETLANTIALETLGAKLDSIAFNLGCYVDSETGNNVYVYYETYNSIIITRSIINTLICDIFTNTKQTSSGELSNTQTAFNSIIDNVVTEIQHKNNEGYVFSWLRELGFINKLVQLDFNTTLSTENVATNIGSVLDGIAFNINGGTYYDVKYNDTTKAIISLPNGILYDATTHTTYGNSVFITRDNLLTILGDLLESLKEDDPDTTNVYEKEDIINELIDNVTNKVASTGSELANTSNYYSSIKESLDDLNTIQTTIDEKLNIGEKLETINAAAIDSTLNNIQEIKLSKYLTTRKMAVYVLNSIYKQMKNESPEINGTPVSFDLHPAGEYLQTLLTYYTGKISANEMEYYSTDDNTINDAYHPNPFVSLQDRINNPTEYI